MIRVLLYCPVCGDKLEGKMPLELRAHAATHPALTEEDLKPSFCDQCGKTIANQPYEHRCNVWLEAILNAPAPFTPPTI